MALTSLRSTRLTAVARAAGAIDWLTRASWRLFDAQGNLSPLVMSGRTTTGTFFDATGTLQTAAASVPRVSFDPANLSGPRFLLAEEARTNLLLQSATLATQTVTVTAVAHTLSFYGSGTVTLSGASSGVVSGIGVYPQRRTFTFTPSAGALTLTVGGAVQFAQLEVGAAASSYIPTTTAAVTRSADNLSVTNLAATGFNAVEGTLYVDYQIEVVSAAFRYPLFISDGTTSNLIGLAALNLSSANGLRVATAGASQAGISASGATTNRTRLAGRYAQDDFATASNGGSVFKDGAGTVPAGMNVMNLGSRNGGFDHFGCRIYQAAIIPTRIPDSGLQRLTRI